jgi:hypothetical protein
VFKEVVSTRKEHLMNLILLLLNGNVDAKLAGALLFAWGVQMIAIVDMALITKAREGAGRSDK